MNWKDSVARILVLDRILAIVGIVLAVCALIITFYQVHLMHVQAKIAVWPHIEQMPAYYDRDPYQPFKGEPIFKYVVTNTGLGPAYIRYVDAKFDGQTLHGGSWDPVMRLLAVPSKWQALKSSNSLDVLQNPLLPGSVLLQGETRDLIEIIKNGAVEARKRSRRLSITICYCSLYGECWNSKSGSILDSPVKKCPNSKTSGFYTGKFSIPKPTTAAPG